MQCYTCLRYFAEIYCDIYIVSYIVRYIVIVWYIAERLIRNSCSVISVWDIENVPQSFSGMFSVSGGNIFFSSIQTSERSKFIHFLNCFVYLENCNFLCFMLFAHMQTYSVFIPFIPSILFCFSHLIFWPPKLPCH